MISTTNNQASIIKERYKKLIIMGALVFYFLFPVESLNKIPTSKAKPFLPLLGPENITNAFSRGSCPREPLPKTHPAWGSTTCACAVSAIQQVRANQLPSFGHPQYPALGSVLCGSAHFAISPISAF